MRRGRQWRRAQDVRKTRRTRRVICIRTFDSAYRQAVRDRDSFPISYRRKISIDETERVEVDADDDGEWAAYVDFDARKRRRHFSRFSDRGYYGAMESLTGHLRFSELRMAESATQQLEEMAFPKPITARWRRFLLRIK
jgi:hypothetical protein